jgi:rhodanese-related sulfurtransferase
MKISPLISIGFILISLICLFACKKNSSLTSINTNELKNILNDPQTYLIDVRSTQEITGLLTKIKQAHHIPLDQLKNKIHEIPKDKNIYLICHSGNRSTAASKLLIQEKFDHVFNVSGGMSAWE